MIDTTRPAVERTLRLAVTNRHITPAIERLALALLARAETLEAALEQAKMDRAGAFGAGIDYAQTTQEPTT